MRYTNAITDAGETVLGWGFWTIIVAVLLIALAFAASIAVAKKAGYSGWWGAIFVLAWPFAWLFIAVFAVLKWPVLKERDEALAVLRENNLTIPRHDRRAVREQKKVVAAEAEAQRNVEKAQAARVKAEAERSKFEAQAAAAPKGGKSKAVTADAEPTLASGDGEADTAKP
jgi:hypothetical protein